MACFLLYKGKLRTIKPQPFTYFAGRGESKSPTLIFESILKVVILGMHVYYFSRVREGETVSLC